MIRKIISIVCAGLLITSCGNKSGKATTASLNAENVQFTALVENPGNYVDKDIIVTGKVVHVCPHTGKKMFIVGDNPDVMLYITAGDNVPKFPMDLQGSTISVEGHISRAVNTEMTAEKMSGEKMMNADMGAGACSDTCEKAGESVAGSAQIASAECETEAALAKQPALADLMMVYNKHTLVK
jgi:hypothetical protein